MCKSLPHHPFGGRHVTLCSTKRTFKRLSHENLMHLEWRTAASRRSGACAILRLRLPFLQVQPVFMWQGGGAVAETQLHISLLGEFNLIFQGQTVSAFSGDRPISLLAYLLLHRRTPVSRQHLAFTLWPDSSESQARTNLRNLVYTLRKFLPDADAYIAADAMTLQWRADTDFVLDVAEFEVTLQRAAGASDAEKEHWLELAVDRYTGDLLPGNYDDWIVPLRETLRHAYLDALHELVRMLEVRKEHRSAARFVQRLLLHDPLDEPAYVQLMRLYARSGDRAGVQRTYAQCVTTLRRELDVEPGPATQAAYAELLQLAPPTPEPTPLPAQPVVSPSSARRLPALPSAATPFIGREAEVAHLAELLADPACRLVTVVGPGGIGKTRLALQCASGHQRVFADGVAWTSLVTMTTPAQLSIAIADAINHRLAGAVDADEEIIRVLASQQMLLVLDNFEHLLDSASVLVDILQQTTGVKLLVTSRQALNVPQEWRYDLGALALPETDAPATLTANSAVQLFVQSARRAASAIKLTAADYPAIVRICQLVGGMPLGIELAAAWVRLLTCAEIAAEIEKSLDFLTVTAHSLPPRHRSLRAVFDYAWARLTPAEQRALAQLSIFPGDFTRAAAIAVAAADLPLLSTLADQGLVQRTDAGRFVLHPLIRQYAGEHLEAAAARADAERRHSEFYLHWLAEQDSLLRSAVQKRALADIAQEFPNIRSAWQWAVGQKLPTLLQRAAFSLFYFLELRNRLQEAESLFRSAADALLANEEPLPRAVVIAGCEMRTNQAYFVTRLGQGPVAEMLLQGVVTQLQRLGEAVVLGLSLRYLAIALSVRSDYDDAMTMLHTSFELAMRQDDRWGAAISEAYLGNIAHDQGRLDASHAFLERALLRCRQIGDPRLIAFTLMTMARTNLQTDHIAEATQQLSECLQIAEETGDYYNLTFGNLFMGAARQAQGDFTAARHFIQQGMTLSARSNDILALKRTVLALGLLEMEAGDAAAARSHFLEILRDDQRTHRIKFILTAVLGLATLQAQAGDPATALVWTFAVLRHPQLDWEAQARGAALRAAIEADLTAATIERAQEASARLTFAHVLADVLQRSAPSA